MIQEALDFIGIHKDWLGEGGEPVSKGQSTERAFTCSICPQNRHPKWWEQSKQAIASVMRKHLEYKNHISISTDHDDDLHMCKVCGCCLPLKVHVPLKHILAHTNSETLAQFPENCWIAREKAESQ